LKIILRYYFQLEFLAFALISGANNNLFDCRIESQLYKTIGLTGLQVKVHADRSSSSQQLDYRFASRAESMFYAGPVWTLFFVFPNKAH
jgi:hypothetical protein